MYQDTDQQVSRVTSQSSILAHQMRSEVVAGLSAFPKSLPSKFFYDERGSMLFEDICVQPEYYLTRTEVDIISKNSGGIADVLGRGVRLVEYGSGSAAKTKLILQALHSPSMYVPVEISPVALKASVEAMTSEFPNIKIQPVLADFTTFTSLPCQESKGERTVVYFPGSTLGNFDRHGALALLNNIRTLIGKDGGGLIGIDLIKNVSRMEAAYNDAAGVTSAFTLNMLAHLNWALDMDFNLNSFSHLAKYNESNSRIETSLVSRIDQSVSLGKNTFSFRRGESIHVECSHKYSLNEFSSLAAKSGLNVKEHWTDSQSEFAVIYLESEPK